MNIERMKKKKAAAEKKLKQRMEVERQHSPHGKSTDSTPKAFSKKNESQLAVALKSGRGKNFEEAG